MKNALLILGIMVLFGIGSCWAGESMTIAVSCSIPVVPGLNAPPFPNQANHEQDTARADEETTNKTSSGEELDTETMLAQQTSATVETYYSR